MNILHLFIKNQLKNIEIRIRILIYKILIKKGKIMKKLVTFILLLSILTLFTTACGTKKSTTTSGTHPSIEILMQDGGKMVFTLYPEYAPETVANFIKLTKAGFYNGLKFHRIMKGFMIQGGDPKGDGTGGSDKEIKGEFSGNGFTQNTLSHKRGVISMARSTDMNSASSQFFIMDADNTGLDGQYAAFGMITEGEDTLTAIANTPVVDSGTGEASTPKTDVIIKSIKVLQE